MEIPKEVKIAHQTFKVTFSDDQWGTSEARGLFIPRNAEIRLAKDMPEQYAAEVFVHEVMEAVKWTYDIDISHKDLTLLGLGLFQALQDSFFSEEYICQR